MSHHIPLSIILFLDHNLLFGCTVKKIVKVITSSVRTNWIPSPPQYRSLFANVVALFWIMYLTNKRRQAAAAAAAGEGKTH